MSKIDKRELKGYVRFDGTGRIVPSSLILRRKKPKVGKWVEIPAYECCNDTTTTVPLAFRLVFENISIASGYVTDIYNVDDWNTFFDLPALGNPFTSVVINGNEVKLYGGSNIKIKPALMYDDVSVVAINDEAGCIIGVGGDAFSYNGNLITVNLPACTIVYGADDSPETDLGGFGGCSNITNLSIPQLITAGEYAFSACSSLTSLNFPNLTNTSDQAFNYCGSLTTVTLPALISVGGGTFLNCNGLTTISLPQATTVGSGTFNGCSSLATISLPSCTNLGATVGDDQVFQNILANTITLTVPSALMTCNSGSPDGDIQELQSNNTVTIVTT